MNRFALAVLTTLVITPALSAQEGRATKKNVLAGRVRTADREGVANAEVVVRWRVAPEWPGLVGWSIGGDDANGVMRAAAKTDAR